MRRCHTVALGCCQLLRGTCNPLLLVDYTKRASAQPVTISACQRSLSTRPAPETPPKTKEPKDYLNKFLLKVHPDLLHGDSPELRKTNQDSLARLNALLDYTAHIRSITRKQGVQPVVVQPGITPPGQQDLVFYSRLTTTTSTPSDSGSVPTMKVESSLKRVHFQVTLPGVLTSVVPYVNYVLGSLLEQAGVDVPSSELHRWSDSWQRIEGKLRSTAPPKDSKKPKIMTEEESEDKYGIPAWMQKWRKDRLLHEDHASTAPKAHETLVHALVKSGKILYMPDLDASQRLVALQNFYHAVPRHFYDMHCPDWVAAGIPVCFGKKFMPPSKGYWIVAWDATPEKVVAYMNLYIDRLVTRRRPEPVYHQPIYQGAYGDNLSEQEEQDNEGYYAGEDADADADEREEDEDEEDGDGQYEEVYDSQHQGRTQAAAA